MNLKAKKRVRLIEAAEILFYQKGINSTTLAHIASLAEVPLGNVYYYFKTKDLITAAVIEKQKNLIQGLILEWNCLSQPLERLQAFVQTSLVHNFEAPSLNAVIGSLCHELSKENNLLASNSSELLNSLIDWSTSQFQQLNHSEHAKRYALNLIANIQGISLISSSLQDLSLLELQTLTLKDWLLQLN